MPVRKAQAVWEGTLKEGNGTMKLPAMDFAYSFASRFEEGAGSNPEELLGAAHAGCFSMALNVALERAGFPAKKVETVAHVKLEKGDAGFAVTQIELVAQVDAPNVDEATFQELAEAAKVNCPISKALASVEITLKATLVS